MIVPLGDRWVVALSAATWLAVSVGVGWWAGRWTDASLDRTGPLTTLRPREDDGGLWQRALRVSRWKDRVPEAGTLSGRSRRTIGSRATDDLVHFRRETVRAERVHWLIWASTPVHLVWCRPSAFAGMVLFGVLFNAPFIVIQRYNRGRVDRVLARRSD